MALFSYVLDHDFGFAPNPFFGVCTLATCKPKIRDMARVGDHIMGTGCAKRGRSGQLIFMMRIDEITSYDAYWFDARFAGKRPNMNRGIAHTMGDNIYHKADDGGWLQADSLHSLPGGCPNPVNVEHDTHSDKVLIGHEFVYFGGLGPQIPQIFRDWGGADVCGRRHYRRHFPDGMADEVVSWAMGLGRGRLGRPADRNRLGDRRV